MLTINNLENIATHMKTIEENNNEIKELKRECEQLKFEIGRHTNSLSTVNKV